MREEAASCDKPWCPSSTWPHAARCTMENCRSTWCAPVTQMTLEPRATATPVVLWSVNKVTAGFSTASSTSAIERATASRESTPALPKVSIGSSKWLEVSVAMLNMNTPYTFYYLLGRSEVLYSAESVCLKPLLFFRLSSTAIINTLCRLIYIYSFSHVYFAVLNCKLILN